MRNSEELANLCLIGQWGSGVGSTLGDLKGRGDIVGWNLLGLRSWL